MIGELYARNQERQARNAAQVVAEFRLPPRHVPAQPGDVLAISDGPSLGDYDPAELERCGATLCGYGRSVARIRFHHYWITDLGFLELLADAPPMEVFACPPVFARRDRAPQHAWRPASEACTYHVAVEARGMFPGSRVFVLGVDGYRRADGSQRQVQHALCLPETERTRTYAAAQFDTLSSRQQQNNSLVLYLNEHRGPTWSLSPDSAYAPIWTVHPSVSQERFGRIDRGGPAAIVDCTGRYPAGELSGWPPAPPERHASYVRGLRGHCPSLAVFVRADRPAELAPWLPADVQVGPPGTTIAAPHRFERIETTWLPAVEEARP